MGAKDMSSVLGSTCGMAALFGEKVGRPEQAMPKGADRHMTQFDLPKFPSQIMVIEEDTAHRHVMKDYLTRADYQVYCVSNGWEALQLIKHTPVDLIISDAEIINTDGSHLREKCLLLSSMRDVPFLFMTDDSPGQENSRATYSSGSDSYIRRPFDPVFLVVRVQSMIEYQRANDRMMRIDSMTRLLNRPTLEGVLATELERIHRYNRYGSMLLIDVDDLGKINQENGVAFGDLMLSSLAAVILKNIRTIDIAGRYHDTIMLLFLPETDKKGAAVLAKRVLDELVDVTDKVSGVRLTFSVGIVGMPDDGSLLPVLTGRGEHALHEAKAQGPGSIAYWDPKFEEHTSNGVA